MLRPDFALNKTLRLLYPSLALYEEFTPRLWAFYDKVIVVNLHERAASASLIVTFQGTYFELQETFDREYYLNLDPHKGVYFDAHEYEFDMSELLPPHAIQLMSRKLGLDSWCRLLQTAWPVFES